MIVNTSLEGLQIILHEAHGLLAGKIANQIAEKHRPIHWFETLIAVCEHDDRQLNFDEKDYLSDIGVPLDFTEEQYTVSEVLKRMQRVLKSAEHKSLWVRLLISYHNEFIYSHMKDKSKNITNFFKKEEQERHALLKHFKITETKAKSYYEFLRFCDRLSLILCKDETPESNRKLEINTSINNDIYFIKKSDDNTLLVSPWIFEKNQFELSVEERILKDTQFKSSKNFETALKNTIPQTKSWKLSKE